MMYLTKIDEVFLEVQCSDDQAKSLNKHLECFSPGYKFSPAYKNRFWNGKISFFNTTNCKLPIGLYDYFVEWATKYGHQFELKWQRPIYQVDDNFIDKFYEIIFEKSPSYPRDYQDYAIKTMLRLRRGVIEYATGSGKSLVIYALIRYLLAFEDRRIVIIVPTIQLVEQLRKEFIDPDNGYGWDKCDDFVTMMYSGAVPDITKPILISTYQSLANKDDSFIMRYNSVIIDECLVDDALIITDKGIKKLSEIILNFKNNIQTKVLSYNEKNKNIEYKNITNVMEKGIKEIIEITMENDNTIKCTPNHLFLTKNRGWIMAGDLSKNDNILEDFLFFNKEKETKEDFYNRLVNNAPLCKCGCGNKVLVSKYRVNKYNSYKYGDFIPNHHNIIYNRLYFEPNQTEIDLIIGTSLADGNIGFPYKTGNCYPRLTIHHGPKQIDYAELKSKTLIRFNTKFDVVKNYGYGKITASVRTGCHEFFNRIINIIYDKDRNNKNIKRFKKEIIPYFNINILMWMYLDNGSISNGKDCKIHCYCFPKDDVYLLSETIKNKFGIHTIPKLYKNKYWGLYFNRENSKLLINQIRNLVPYCMKYKLGML